MMRITTQGDYGLVCVLRIARGDDGRPMSVRRISDAERLPRHYVEKLLGRLRRSGLVASVRGPAGGYVLTRRPSEIAVKDVIDALERDTFGVICFKGSHPEACFKLSSCFVGPLWMELKTHIDSLLGSLTLAMLLDEDKDIRQTIRTISAENAIARARQPAPAEDSMRNP